MGHFQLNGSLWWWWIWTKKEYLVKRARHLSGNKEIIRINLPPRKWQIESITPQISGKVFDKANYELWPNYGWQQHFDKHNIQNVRHFFNELACVFIDRHWCSKFQSWNFYIFIDKIPFFSTRHSLLWFMSLSKLPMTWKSFDFCHMIASKQVHSSHIAQNMQNPFT